MTPRDTRTLKINGIVLFSTVFPKPFPTHEIRIRIPICCMLRWTFRTTWLAPRPTRYLLSSAATKYGGSSPLLRTNLIINNLETNRNRLASCFSAIVAVYVAVVVGFRFWLHVPPSRDAARDAVPAFFDLLREEAHQAVTSWSIFSSSTFIPKWTETVASVALPDERNAGIRRIPWTLITVRIATLA